MKACTKCGQIKSLSDFGLEKRVNDGHAAECRLCARQRKTAFKKTASGIEAEKRYWKSEKGVKKRKELTYKSRSKWPEKHHARIAFSNAVAEGKITPWPVCAVPECNNKPQGHHPSYDLPFDVVWLCGQHHREVHQLVEV